MSLATLMVRDLLPYEIGGCTTIRRVEYLMELDRKVQLGGHMPDAAHR